MRPFPLILTLIGAILACSPGAIQSDNHLLQLPQIPSLQLFEDLDQYKSEMEAYHPGLFWYQRRSDWVSLFEEARRSVANGSDLFTFFGQLASINARVGCGHTRMSLSRDFFDQWTDTLKVVPFSIQYIGGKTLVNESFVKESPLQKGDEVISINGIKSSEITDRILPYLAMDGFNLTGKFKRLESRFPLLYATFIDPLANEFDITFRSRSIDGEQDVKLAGADFSEYESSRNNDDIELLVFKKIEGRKNSYYMKIQTFSSSWMRSGGYDYQQFLEDAFGEIRENKGENLILDLRGNGGGDDGNGSRLMSYFMNQTFGYYGSIEVTASYDGWGDIEKSEDGRYLVTAHRDLQQHQPDRSNFKGKVFILIDGGSFSATSEFAALMFHHKRATFIGEETGGGYYGNTSGNRKRITLKNTGISVSIPFWRYLVDVEGNEFYGKGVVPHHQVVVSTNDFVNSIDTSLDFAKRLIAN